MRQAGPHGYRWHLNRVDARAAVAVRAHATAPGRRPTDSAIHAFRHRCGDQRLSVVTVQ